MYKFEVYDKDTAKEIKQILRNKKNAYIRKKKDPVQKPIVDNEVKHEELKNEYINSEPIKKKRGRKKLSSEEKKARKAKRTPEEQAKINERMAKLRAIRAEKKKNKK